MKALFWFLAAFLIVFFLGCQENSITDPGTIDDNAMAVQNDQNLPNKDMISTLPGVIDVFKTVYDPTHPQNDGAVVKGFIRFKHSLIPGYATPDQSICSVGLKIYVNLSIYAKCPMHDDCMKVVALTDHTVDLPPSYVDSFQEVEKVFSVSNTCCGRLNLVLKFGVDKNDLKLLSMSLKKVYDSMYMADPD